ncbi:ribosome quality control complex subunit NEMF [Capsicum galapagoense]
MVKVRMNTADVAAEVKCLRRLIGMRCSNVYDLSPKTYVFKLMNSSGITESGESEKVLLLMESGVRLHTTAYLRDKSNTPSGFTLKLRKHIRTRRLEDVRQLGYDRIILFQFGLGANAHYVILELYAQGNILLTDSDFMVLTLLRSHRDDDKGLAIMSRHRYPVEICRVFKRTTTEKLQAALMSSAQTDKIEQVEDNERENDGSDAPQQKRGNQKSIKAANSTKKGNDGARAKSPTLKVVLGEALGYGPALSEHIIQDASLVPNTKIDTGFKLEGNTLHSLTEAVNQFEDWLEEIILGEKVPEGYILMQQKALSKKDSSMCDSGSSEKMYDEFCPLLLNQLKCRDFMKFETFDAALDEFYSKIESQRSEQLQKSKESTAMQKLNKIRADQENRVVTLKQEVEHCIKMAELIEYNLEDVDAAILAVRVALANGMSWEDLARMVKEEKRSGNPVAGLIDKLHLERNCMTLLLSNNLDEMDDDEKTQPVDKVEVDLALSAHANARRWYEMKKRQENKQEKTVTAHEKAFKAAERKTRLQLSQEKTVAVISHMRKVHWFEKFNWFISSENYLVISGRDAQQNEMIVKRYMSKGDLYIHADLHGASSTVIKNHKPEMPIPPLTLNQVGCFTVCQSQAWDSKIVTSAWWVYPHQVSKTAPTGEYLTVGSFMIRGKKNFLPPHPLVMGFGILFRLEESSLGFHLNERRVRGEEEGLNDAEQSEPSKAIHDSSTDEELSMETPVVDMQDITDLPKARSSASGVSSAAQSNIALSTSDDQASNLVNSSAEVNCINNDGTSDFLGIMATSGTSQLEYLIDRALEIGSSTASTKNHGVPSLFGSARQHDEEEKRVSQREKPYITKTERRKLKKGSDSTECATTVRGKHSEEKQKQCVGDVNKARSGCGKVIRGQKGKLKKIKEKYADQDEEERRIRMALLASAGKVEKVDQTIQSDKADAEPAKGAKATTGLEDAAKICYKCKKAGHLSRDCQENADESMQSTSNEGDAHSLTNVGNAAHERDRIVMEEEDIHEIGEEEKEKLNDVDYLTGNPLPNDILLYAVPVCGPYNAVRSFKYRVKLVPGTVKRGKAAKTAMNLFSHMPEATSREKELMKACTDPELVAAIMGNVKITSAGLTQLKQKQKKSKKSSKAES